MKISLVFYILAINTWTSNFKIQYHSQSLKNEILRYKSYKHVQDLLTENYTMLMKVIRDLNKWRDIPYP